MHLVYMICSIYFLCLASVQKYEQNRDIVVKCLPLFYGEIMYTVLIILSMFTFHGMNPNFLFSILLHCLPFFSISIFTVLVCKDIRWFDIQIIHHYISAVFKD